jgi:hypothetical protein
MKQSVINWSVAICAFIAVGYRFLAPGQPKEPEDNQTRSQREFLGYWSKIHACLLFYRPLATLQ